MCIIFHFSKYRIANLTHWTSKFYGNSKSECLKTIHGLEKMVKTEIQLKFKYKSRNIPFLQNKQ